MSYTREWEEQKRENRNELIRVAFSEGWPAKKIAAEYGVSDTTVYHVVYDMPWPSDQERTRAIKRAGGPPQRRLPPERLQQVSDYDENTWSRSQAERVRVYFIQDGEFVKIGITYNHAGERLSQLQCGNPRTLVLRRTIQGVSEAELHEHFAHLRERGEWFRIDAELEALMSSDEVRTINSDSDLGDPK